MHVKDHVTCKQKNFQLFFPPKTSRPHWPWSTDVHVSLVGTVDNARAQCRQPARRVHTHRARLRVRAVQQLANVLKNIQSIELIGFQKNYVYSLLVIYHTTTLPKVRSKTCESASILTDINPHIYTGSLKNYISAANMGSFWPRQHFCLNTSSFSKLQWH